MDSKQKQSIEQIRAAVAQVIVGKEKVTDLLLAALLAQGHVLLEDVPGTGKTMLVRAISKAMGMENGRVQFTPDLLPADVTGISFYNQKSSEFEFRKGPVFTNILLADEINRATPRTQSSLLECMGEGQVTTDGETRSLPQPFFVIATQNPVETLGCFPLPEAQLDRFLIKLSMGSLTQEQEKRMVDLYIDREPICDVQAVCGREEILALQKLCREVFVHDELRNYIVQLVQETRKQEGNGVSPRGTLALLRMSQGYAMVSGRDFVVPEDIKTVAPFVLVHRMLCQTVSETEKDARIRHILQTVTVPTENWEKL